MSTINQKEYLKKYLGIGKSSGDKKKKKKKDKVVSTRMKIIDDDADYSISNEIQQDLNAEDEDAPQIVAVIDDRPPSLRIDEKTNSKLWQPLTPLEDTGSGKQSTIKMSVRKRGESNKTFEENSFPSKKDSDKSLLGKNKDKDFSPPRRNKDKDFSPPRRNKDNDSSPPRKNQDRDFSPPRRYKEKDSSPPRRNKDIDFSPPRRNKHKDSSPPRKNKEKDFSPPRRNKDKDFSPPRRNKDKDSSPPRKNKDTDSSPPRRNNDIDFSPPRRNKHKDSSPPRKNKNTDSSPPRKKRRSVSPKRKSRWESESKTSENTTKKTLEGKKAGLQNAEELAKETASLRRREDELFKNLSEDVSGRNAETVVRHKKRKDPEEEALEKLREQENKEKYNKWGRGLKQVEDINEKVAQDLHEMSKPLARYADDEDLEKYLKEQEREGDPMLAYIRKKKHKKVVESGAPIKPTYQGEFMPNRFGIRPGYRWDGVDRSNGYEKKWFDVQNARKAALEDSYKWSTEDM